MLDLFVSHLIDLVKEKAIDLVKEKAVVLLKDQYELRSGVADKLTKIVEVLGQIEAVANTADGVDLEKHKSLKAWTWKLKAAAEEARDVLDEFEYLFLKRQVEEEGADDVGVPCKRSKISIGSFIPSSISKPVKKFFGSTDQLERLSNTLCTLDELASRSGEFLQLVADRKATDREHHKHDDGGRRETTSSVVEPNWIGRQGVLKEVINKLLEPVSDGGRIPVLAVVGLGGMGKTTLAQHVINDPKVKSHFNVTMWAYVSQVFHVPTLTKKILESAAPNMICSHSESLETLQQKLKTALKFKRFLLVLDDLWYDQKKFTMEEEWNKLCSPLVEAGGRGSKILLTSRTSEVKDLTAALTTMKLQGLEQDECWSIIQRCAFLGHETLDQHLVEIGMKIALKVQGSPLAAKAVGRILRNNMDSNHWSKILKEELSKIGENDVMPVLELSYRHLPPHLRQCFAFCSLFPKGHIFSVDMLVRMWVAQDYIRGRANGEETEEDIGRRYFDDLLSAGFFARTFCDESYAVMHDLMNDLARFVSKDEFFWIEDILQLQDGGDIPKTVRHLSVRTEYLPNLSKKGYNFSNLHTLITISYSEVDDEVVKYVLRKLRRVRVLGLGFCPVKELPEDIGHLVHLRYLDMLRRDISRLPEALSRLYHLQVLNIIHLYGYLTECFAEKLHHLVKLRSFGAYQYLTLTSDKKYIKLTRIKGLKYLQVLSISLVVEEGRGDEIRNLKALNKLRKELVLENLDYVESCAAAREADLCGKKWLQKLDLNWSKWIFGEHSSTCNPEVAADVLEGLQPPYRLEQLIISNYPGKVCPNWMSNLWLTNLRSIVLKYLLQLECLPPLGQLPLLRSLELVRMPRVRKLSQEGFPSLKSLKINVMEELEEWDGSGGFPCLEVLQIVNCPKMRELPTLVPTLTKLYIFECGNLTSLGGEGLLHRLRNLEELTLLWCEQLRVSLLDERLRDLMYLKRLQIKSCPNLKLVAPNQDLGRGLLPPSLEVLELSNLCDETLSRFLHGLGNLSKLEVSSCPCLKSMASREELAHLTSLQELTINDCQSLTASALENLPALPSLKSLILEEEIKKCLGGDGESMARGPFSLAIESLEIDDPWSTCRI